MTAMFVQIQLESQPLFVNKNSAGHAVPAARASQLRYKAPYIVGRYDKVGISFVQLAQDSALLYRCQDVLQILLPPRPCGISLRPALPPLPIPQYILCQHRKRRHPQIHRHTPP